MNCKICGILLGDDGNGICGRCRINYAGHHPECSNIGVSPMLAETCIEAMRDLVEECESHPDNPDPDTLATAKTLLREWDEWRKIG